MIANDPKSWIRPFEPVLSDEDKAAEAWREWAEQVAAGLPSDCEKADPMEDADVMLQGYGCI